MIEKEIEALHKYIETNLTTSYIQESHSPAGYLIIFILKKNRKLRLYINY